MPFKLDFFQDEAEYEWLCQRYENMMSNRITIISNEEKKRLAEEMLKSQNFDNFLATKFSNVKRYGGEGAEAMMGFFVELLDNANTKCNYKYSDRSLVMYIFTHRLIRINL